MRPVTRRQTQANCKQNGIGGDTELEIHKTVDQHSNNAAPQAAADNPVSDTRRGLKLGKKLSKPKNDRPTRQD